MRRHPWILRLGLLAALCIPAVFLAGCGGSSGSSHTQLAAAELSSAQEVPASSLTATGSCTVSLNQAPSTLGMAGATTIAVNLQTVGIDPNQVTSIAIYNGNPGTNGQRIFTLFDPL